MNDKYFINEQDTVLLKLDSEKPKQFRVDPFEFKYTGEMVKSGFAKSRSLIFEVTERCNLNCSYCTYNNLYTHHLKRNKTDLTFNKVRRLIDFYFDLQRSFYFSNSVPVAIGFYGGEPLLNMKLIKEIIQYAENITRHIRLSMTSNGLLLDRYIDFLVEKDFALLISLDGNEEHNGYRLFHDGKSSFNQVYSNAKLISKKYPAYFDKKVRFNAVIHKRNSIGAVYDFFLREFNKTPYFSEISLPDKNDKAQKEFNDIYRNVKYDFDSLLKRPDALKDEKIMRIAYTYLFEFFKKHDGNSFENFTHLLSKRSKDYIPTGTCFPFSRKIFLTCKGKILPCERIGDIKDLGLVSDNIVDIDFNKIAELYNSYYQNLRERCLSCIWLRDCSICLFHIKNISTKKPDCDLFKKLKNSKNNFLIQKNMEILETNPILYKYYLDNISII